MEVYFLRHGQTNGNVARRHQHSETPLNAKGEAQVREIAEQLLALQPTHIISSSQLRAVETARIIAQMSGLVPATQGAFEELGRPLWLVGYRYTSLTTLNYVVRWFFGEEIEEGESYQAFMDRIDTARRYLESLPSDSRVIVVSHAVFTNIFLEHLCLGKRMSLHRALVSFVRILLIRNVGIVHLRFSPGSPKCGWSVLRR